MKIDEIKQQIFKNVNRVEEKLQSMAEDRQMRISGDIWYN